MSNQNVAMTVTSVQDTLSRVQLRKTDDVRVPYLFKETFAFNSIIADREQRKVTAEVYLELFDKMFDEGAKQFQEITGRVLGDDVLPHHKKNFGRTGFLPLLRMLNGTFSRAVPYLRSSAGYVEVSFFMGVRMVPADFGLPKGMEMHWDDQPFPVFAWHLGISGVETDINDPLKIVHREIIQHVGCLQ